MLWTRRIRRICSAMGVAADDLDLHPVFDVAPISSMEFQEALRRDLDDLKPGLVTMDPFYTYHGTSTKASDLHQEGALLNRLSGPCMDAGASLLVANHMNQAGRGMNLKRITMAGSGEWADSWLLVEHRKTPDVTAGSFKLTLEVGSRQWGGSTWNLDLEIGRFNEESGTHDGEISWKLERSTGSGAKQELRDDRGAGTRETLLEKLAASPWSLTKTELKDEVGGSREVFDAVFRELVEAGCIENRKLPRAEAGTTKTRPLWGLVPTPADQERPSGNRGVA